MTLECIEWLIDVLNSLVFCLYAAAGCFVFFKHYMHVFPCGCVLSDVDLLHFMCVQCVGVVLQRIDPCQRVMFLLHDGHMYFVCCPGLIV